MAKMRAAETTLGAPPLLDALREELEGLSNKKAVIAKRTSALARIRKIRNVHAAQLHSVFFMRSHSGNLVFFYRAGNTLLKKLFIK